MIKKTLTTSSGKTLLFLLLFFLQLYSNPNEIRKMTGGKDVGFVWVKPINNNAWQYKTTTYKLYTYNTKSNEVKQICPNNDCTEKNYSKPLFSPDGKSIIYSIPNENFSVFKVDLDGTNKISLGTGYATSTRRINGVDYAIILTEVGTKGFKKAYQVSLENPQNKILLWDKDELGIYDTYYGKDVMPQGWFSVSADGKRGVDANPWPSIGVFSLPNNTTIATKGGCWCCIAPDNSYMYWVLQDPHVKVKLFNSEHNLIGDVTINQPFGSKQSYFPKWSANDVNFVVMSGPDVFNSNSDLYFGKFSSDFKSISWQKVNSETSKGHYFPDAYVYSGQTEATMSLSSAGLDFEAIEGGTNPPAQTIDVTSNSEVPASVTLTRKSSWLEITQQKIDNNKIKLTNSVSIKGLSVGTYKDTVTLSAAGFTSKSYVVLVVIRKDTPVLSAVVITPDTIRVAKNDSVKFTAKALDQLKMPLAVQPKFVWTTSGGGTIDSSGLFRSGQVTGTFKVYVSAGIYKDTAVVIVDDLSLIITVTSPNGGEKFKIGDTLIVTWVVDESKSPSGVVIELSVDNGKNFNRIIETNAIAPTDTSWKKYKWVIRDSIDIELSTTGEKLWTATPNARIRVKDYWNPAVFDISNNSFSIADRSGKIPMSPLVMPLKFVPKRLIYFSESTLYFEGWGVNSYTAKLVTPQGQLIAAKTVSGKTAVPILKTMPEGMYFVTVESQTDKKTTIIFINK